MVNPTEVAKTRKTAGASTPKEIEKMINDRKKRLGEAAGEFERNLKNLLKSKRKIEESISMLISEL